MNKLKNIFYISIVSVFLTACGGGGGGSSTPPPPPANVAPTANAGVAQAVDEGATVNLTGTGTDSDGTISTYAWTQVSGTAVTLTNANMQNASFVAPSTASQTSIALVLRLTVTDDDGATGFSDITVTVNTTNQAPVASAGVDQSVTEQSTVSLDAAGSTDPENAIVSYLWTQGPSSPENVVTIVNPDSATASFMAPSLSTVENLTFTVTVTDDRGASSTGTVTITVNPDPALNTAPVANAGTDVTTSSAQASNLDGSASADSDGSIASYAWTQTAGATIALTSANTATPSFTAPTVTADTTYTFELTVTDNEGATATDSVDVLVTPMAAMVTIRGKATYSNVPHTSGNALDYSAITQDPIRNAVVELLQNGAIFQSGVTDVNGDYSFDVDPNTTGNFSVRVKSQAVQTAPAAWDVRIVDNTNSQAIYSIVGSDFTVATTNIDRPTMNATTTFNGTSYTNISGAPFHVLDRVMDGMLKIQAIDSTVTFPLISINWSVNNSATGGSVTTGAIGTSFFTSNAGTGFTGPQIFLLGAADSDTDEYDGHVIIHEWGHYFENTLARSDSIGGSHSGNQRLDMRLAFGEGFGNAWAGIMTDDSFYRDSRGVGQTEGFSINVESGAGSTRGWYNEQSTASIIYDVYDSNDDGADTVSLGLKPLYDVLVGQQRNTDALTSIFSFATYLKAENPTATSGINAILTAESISGTDIWGAGETNDAGRATDVLPVYTDITVGGPAVNICSLNAFDTGGDGNKLSVYRFMRVDIPTAGNYRVTVSATTGQDPDIQILKQGRLVGLSEANGAEDSVISLANTGEHAISVYNFNNVDANANAANECYNVQIQTAP